MKPWERFAEASVEGEIQRPPWSLEWEDPELVNLKQDEGFRDTAYKDSVGVKTIGYGTAATGGRDIPEKIDLQTAESWLREDVRKAREKVDKLVPDADQQVKDILTNMTYQMGGTGVRGFSKMIKAIKVGDYEEAAEQMLKSDWANQTPNRASRLADRMRSINSSDNSG